MSSKLRNFVLTVICLFAMTCAASAQVVVRDTYDGEFHHIKTEMIPMVTSELSHYPISISLNYHQGYPTDYYIRIQSKLELDSHTSLHLEFSDGSQLLLEPWISRTIKKRLLIIRLNKTHEVVYPLNNQNLKRIKNLQIVRTSVLLDDSVISKSWTSNAIGKWLSMNANAIEKKL